MFSEFFIRRPIFATVLSIVIVLIGAGALVGLPISQYPEILPPQISVDANYSGASAEVVADTVAAPLENQINGATDMIYMNSVSSSDGRMSLTVTFETGTDPDDALVEVNNRIAAATPMLPEPVRRLGVTARKSMSSILGVAVIKAPDGRYDEVFVSNYALVNVVDELKRIPGVKPYPSDANYVLFRLENAGIIWEMLYGRGVLVRDFSRAPGLEDCLRVSIGSREENDAFLRALRDAVMGKCDLEVPSA